MLTLCAADGTAPARMPLGLPGPPAILMHATPPIASCPAAVAGWCPLGLVPSRPLHSTPSAYSFFLFPVPQPAEAAQPPNHTPKVLETMRQSRMWRAMTAAVNHDIHAVGG